MAILIWRVLMVIVAIALLVAVIWVVTRTVNSVRRQKQTIRHLNQKAEPDISDAEYQDVGNTQVGKNRASDNKHGE